jgi:hypothetical protein
MDNIVAPAFFVGVLVLVLGGSVFLSRWQAKRARENLAALARDLGLQLEEKPPSLGLFPQVPTVCGERGGRALRFYTFTTGSGKQRQVWQAMGLACANPRGLSFQFGAQNVLTAFGVMLGMQDVQVGDPVFDERFVVKTNAPDFLRAALLPEIRTALLQNWAARGVGANVKLDGGELHYAELGSFAEAGVTARMRAMLEPLCALATLPEVYHGEH